MEATEIGALGELDVAELDPAVEAGLPEPHSRFGTRVERRASGPGPGCCATPYAADRDRSDQWVDERRTPEVPALGEGRAAGGPQPVDRAAPHLHLVQELCPIERRLHQHDAIEPDRLGELAPELQPVNSHIANGSPRRKPLHGFGRGECLQGLGGESRLVVGQHRGILGDHQQLGLERRTAFLVRSHLGSRRRARFDLRVGRSCHHFERVVAIQRVHHAPPQPNSQD